MASAFGIFLLRQTFKTIPRELEEAARVEGCSWLGVLWRVYVPLARPTYLAYALVSAGTPRRRRKPCAPSGFAQKEKAARKRLLWCDRSPTAA